MKINTLIIEDEQDARVVLQRMCEQFTPNINILGFEKSLKEAATFIKDNPIDLVF
jgi:response regulator of citrate/malate metabolism